MVLNYYTVTLKNLLKKWVQNNITRWRLVSVSGDVLFSKKKQFRKQNVCCMFVSRVYSANQSKLDQIAKKWDFFGKSE